MKDKINSLILSEKLPTTKKDVIAMLTKLSSDITNEMRMNPKHTLQYYNAFMLLINKVSFEISTRNVFDAPPEWFFSFEVSNKNAALYIRHIADLQKKEDNKVLFDIDETFRLINYPVKLLSVEEYASITKTEQVTVRQWIRRGKLRNAIKIGGEWRIPEISDPPTRGYTPVRYYNNSRQFLQIPKELGVLMNQQPSIIDIYQSPDRKGYIVLYDNAPAIFPNRLIKEAEREKLELMLISNPNITNSSSIVGRWPKINEVEIIKTIRRSGIMTIPDGWNTNLF